MPLSDHPAEHYALLRAYSGAAPAAPAQRQHSALLADGGGGGAAQQQQQQQAQQNAPQDEYCYKDPQGVIQGPFARADIIDWCARWEGRGAARAGCTVHRPGCRRRHHRRGSASQQQTS